MLYYGEKQNRLPLWSKLSHFLVVQWWVLKFAGKIVHLLSGPRIVRGSKMDLFQDWLVVRQDSATAQGR